jgi:serine protease Do
MVKRWHLILGLGALIGAGITYVALREGVVAQERAVVAFTPQERATLTSLESALTRIAETVQPTVVHIRATRQYRWRWTLPRPDDRTPDDQLRRTRPRPDDRTPDDQMQEFLFEFGRGQLRIPPPTEGQGSGVIVRSDGYIVTNDHVVSGATDVEVTFHDGTKAKGEVLRAPSADIAVIKVDRKNLPVAVLGDSSTVKPGQIVFAIGSPFGLANTLTMGVISATGRREVIPGAGRIRTYSDLIQTDAAINSGNSGGPLVNSRGEVIGINTAIVANGFTGGNVGIGFAIPINRVRTIVQQLIEKGSYRRGYLGVALSDIPADMKDELKATQGILIRSVEKGTPAEQAGIEPGDIVTEVDGVPVRNESHFREMIADKGPGATVTLKVLRDGKSITVKATLTNHPDDVEEERTARAEPSREQSTLEKLGVTVGEIPAELRRELGSVQGVYVSRVAPDSPAANELQEGDVIVAVNRTPVKTVAELERALKEVPSGRVVRMRVLRKVEERTMEVLIMFRMP